MRTRFLTFIFVSACGGKIDGSVEGGLADASTRDAKSDPPPATKDGGPIVVDASIGCTPATVDVLPGGDTCGMSAEWSCGGTKFRASGACSMPNGLKGACTQNGMQVKLLVSPSCNCQDPQFPQMFAKLCGFPPPP